MKINVKSLAEEARINRKEARKLAGMDRWILNDHRTGSLREESRLAQLAYAFLRGKPKSAMDQRSDDAAIAINGKLRRAAGVTADVREIEQWLTE